MISAHEAYLVGYTPTLVGIYFNGVELCAAIGEGATDGLAQRVTERVATFKARQSGVIANVRVVEALVQKAGLQVGPPPKFPAEFHAWAEQIFNQAHAALAADAQVAAAHLLGYVLGDALLTLNILLFVEHFRDASPEQPFLRAQEAALTESLSKIARQLDQAVALPTLLPATRYAALPALQIASAIAAGGGAPGERAKQLDGELYRLGEVVSAVEKTLVLPPA